MGCGNEGAIDQGSEWGKRTEETFIEHWPVQSETSPVTEIQGSSIGCVKLTAGVMTLAAVYF